MRVHSNVASALEAGRPVVALESTIISHGMPYPENVETGIAMEAAVSEFGAVPATVAMIDGKIVVGVDQEEMDLLGRAGNVAKISLRDIGMRAVEGGLGATTVAATMYASERAGISVFATGGIGGVHRGFASHGDVSADLTALGTVPVAVVSAGVKAILDIPRTLEVLETLGVPVIGFRTDRFPAFYTRDSGLPVPYRADTHQQAAAMVAGHWDAGLRTGVLVANPIPTEAEANPVAIEQTIKEALDQALHDGVGGSALSPFLLSEVVKRTGGASLRANIALALSNASVAAELAMALSAIRSS